MRLKKTPWFSPYDKAGNCTLKDTGTGVYLIKSDNGPLVYIGYAGTDLKKTMYRHFQQWNDPTQKRATYNKNGYKCRVIWVSTAKNAYDLENSLILRLKPRDNEQKLDMYLNRAKDIEREYIDAEQIKPSEPCPF